MKKILFILICTLMISCTSNVTESKNTYTEESRIEFVESKVIQGRRISIISIDGIEFVTNSNGGIVKLK